MKLAAIAVLALLAVPAFAQTETPTAPPATGMHRGPGGHGFGGGYMHPAVAPVTSAPFTARYTVESQHTAPGPDGLVSKFTGAATIYRDSLGRTREDVPLPQHPPRSGVAASTPSASPRVFTVIVDPVANTVTHLFADQKTAIVETVPAGFFKRAIETEARDAAGTTRADSGLTVTDLGSRVFAGVSATGRRTTRTFTPKDGTSPARTMTHDAWFSPDLKIEVSSTETGGRGTSGNTLTALTRAEPDATLFKVPEGYTVKAATPHDHHGRGPGGVDVPPSPNGF